MTAAPWRLRHTGNDTVVGAFDNRCCTQYYPWDYYIGERDLAEQDTAMDVGRQKQVARLIRTSFLKRFESSVFAFKASRETLMKKLIAFYQVHAEDRHDKDRLDKWLGRNKDITGFDPQKQNMRMEPWNIGTLPPLTGAGNAIAYLPTRDGIIERAHGGRGCVWCLGFGFASPCAAHAGRP